MKQIDNEAISALLDDELNEESQTLIKSLSKDKELKSAWASYQTISDVIKGETQFGVVDLSAAISEKIADEPSILAPSTSKPSRFTNNRFTKPFAGLAIAASVAAVAVLSIQQLQKNIPGADLGNAPSIAAIETAPNTGVSLVANNNQNVIDTNNLTDQQKAALQSRLDHYLLNHYQRNNTKGVQGVMPYARIVTHEIEAN